MASIHDKLKRVRKPRVHITYEVETGGAMVKKELPFVVGVLGDFSGNPTTPLKPLKDRKFVQIDRDNFDEVMRRMTPGLNMRVENTLQGDGSEMAVQLKFDGMSDFEPVNVAKQVEPLRKLLSFRQLNLLDPHYPMRGPFDAIFCRNVMIYFDKKTQMEVLKRLVHLLAADGLFFAGHSESFFHASDLIRSVGRTIYRRAGH